MVARCAAQLAIGVALLAGHVSMPVLAGLAALTGAAVAFGVPAVSPLIASVVSPDDPDGMELVLESNANPAGKAYQEALRGQGRPAAQFLVNDVQAEHDRLAAKAVKFTMPVTSTTGSVIAVLDDTCGNLIQLVKLTWG